MKKTLNVNYLALLALACVAPSHFVKAQCPQICDSFPTGNTAFGNGALVGDSGSENTAIGFNALNANKRYGTDNTAIGAFALESNTSGYNNTATGSYALASNTVGWQNTANGLIALAGNTTGNANTATGDSALNSNSIGNGNTAIGEEALYLSTTGNNNTAIGLGALYLDTNGNYNIAVGFEAGMNLTTGRNNIDIFDKGVAGESNTIRIGTARTQTNAYIAGISGVTVAGGVGVIIDARGHLGTAVSSERFKDQIKSMDKASEAILALKPVTFHYKHELDPDAIPQFGLVAEEVAKVAPDLVARDEAGKPYTVRYEAVNAMLLNEFLKEHRKVEQQDATIVDHRNKSAISEPA